MNTQEQKAKLEAEKKVLEEELSGLGHKNVATGEWEAAPETQTDPESDPNDMADRAEGFEERSAESFTLNARLDDIKKALGKIENGIYGTCEVCGLPIEEDRLEANPAARTCKADMEK